MNLPLPLDSLPPRWHGFELSILRRLKFRSAAIPFAGDPGLEIHLKRWGVRLATNDTAHWAWTKAVALVENNTERLTEDDLDIITADAYVPRHKLGNTALRRWFNESDAWWFDNVRANLEKLESATKQALALTLGMNLGDYVFSFDEETSQYRLPLSQAIRQLWRTLPPPVDNHLKNQCAHMETRDFLAEQNAELFFLRLPPPARRRASVKRRDITTWREEWVRGDDSFWDEVATGAAGRLGAPVETKQQYLSFVEDTLERAAHIRAWAIMYLENPFVSTEELVETIRHVRRVETIYTKDFSALSGTRAAIITAL